MSHYRQLKPALQSSTLYHREAKQGGYAKQAIKKPGVHPLTTAQSREVL